MYNEFLAHTSNALGQLYDCREPGGFANPACKPFTGVYIVESLGFPFRSLWTPIVALMAFAAVFIMLSAVLFRFHVPDWSSARVHEVELDSLVDEQRDSPKSSTGRRAPEVRLRNYGLCVRNRSVAKMKTTEVPLFKSINATFVPGVLNFVLGPSGSGKTLGSLSSASGMG